MEGIHRIDLYHFDLIDPYKRISQRCLCPMYDNTSSVRKVRTISVSAFSDW